MFKFFSIIIDNEDIEIDRQLKQNDTKTLLKPILCDEITPQFKMYLRSTNLKSFYMLLQKHVPLQEKFPWEAIKTNIFGTFNLSEVSIEHKVEKFVLVSTDKAVRPTNVMGATKE